ncbi:hypothetical protein [Roseateles saccharophilus]|uniref:Uncharacterized protein n=1 Tax=Roseateles saccharophilus TaxID=304 RepID=A0A4R3ULF8_ROSSA|nr:hypothetical protein [Roseateles saccharophilus]MDG0834179.1 hypothetical protein [Roseateles saccharophilus]TCU91300.1 hypothetical protein EV671_102615 [Roseateles saccharophilus]
MARARSLKPGFFKNEDLAECSCWARLCFAGLWTLADREGRLEDRPKRIKGELFAYDTVEVDPLLAELAQHGFILRYSDGSRGLIQILKFRRHQNPHHKEPASVLPSPQSLGLLPDGMAVEPEAEPSSHDDETPGKPEASPGFSGDECAMNGVKTVLTPDSLNLTPDSLNPRRKARGSPAEPAGFADFWAAYPRKVGKADALKAFGKLQAGPELVAMLVQAVQRQRASEQWQRDGGQYVPHPATWLNGRRWEDELGAAGASSGGPAGDATRPAWALSAGFANRFEAENAGCFEHTSNRFADGRRLETA